jgi:hypothetical protein
MVYKDKEDELSEREMRPPPWEHLSYDRVEVDSDGQRLIEYAYGPRLFGNRESDKDHHSWGVASNGYDLVDPLHVQRDMRPPDAPRNLEDYKEWIGRIQSLRTEAIRLHLSSYEKRNVEITAKTSVQEQRKQLYASDK